MRALCRIAAVAALTAASQCATAPPAYAISPPPVDNALLPAAAPPAPPRPTVQREVCATTAFDPQRASTQLDGLDLPTVWPLTRGAGQRIAVIDTGVGSHRRLPRLVGGGDYVSAGDGTRDCDGHGTLVAGIIAAAPGSDGDRFTGVAPEATVIAIRQSSTRFGVIDEPSRTGVGDVDTLAKAVRTAADLGASVIHISAVVCGTGGSEVDDRVLGAALAYAAEVKSAVVVAPAGNTDGEGCSATDAPVSVSPPWYDDYVLTVGSVDAAGAPSAFTLPGPWVDVAAPGEAVLSLSPIGDAMANTVGDQHDPAPIAGTGYAAAVVSGLAALIRARFAAWTPRQVMDRIRATAHHPPGGRDDSVGSGLIDPLAAVSTGAPPGTSLPSPKPIAAPVTPPATPEIGERVALTGAAALLSVLVLTLTARAVSIRLRRLGRAEDVMGD